MRKRFFGVLLFVALAVYASAATYYVSQAGAGAGDGSTLGNAASVATLNAHTSAAGDLILLNGTITSNITVHNSGSVGNPITYQYAASAKSSKAFWGLTTSAAIYATGKSYVVVDGNNVGIIECTANGDLLANQQQSCGIYTTGCDNFTVKNLTIQNIFIHTAGQNNPGGVGTYTTTCWKADGCTNLQFFNCVVNNAYCGAFWAIDVTGTKNPGNIYSNTFSACSTAIVLNTTTNGVDVNGGTMHDNDITMGLNWNDPVDANHIDGIHTWTVSAGNHGTMTNLRIYKNYIHGDGSAAHSTAHIYLTDYLVSGYVYDNVLIGSTNAPGEGYVNINVLGTSDVYLYNNTIRGISTTNTGGNGIAFDPSTAGTTGHLRNNIIINCYIGIYNTSNNITWDSDYNDLFGNGSVGRTSSFQTTLANWRTATGGDANSVSTTPNLSATYYMPTVTSGAIGSGQDLSGTFTVDIAGATRSAPWDMGAVKSGSSSWSVGAAVGPVAPTLSSASINSAGTQLTLVWSASCTTGAGGNGGVTISPSGGASTATYSSGSGSTAYVYNLSRTILQGETLTVSYTQPGNGIEATSDQTDVATFSGSAVTNGSTTAAPALSSATINAAGTTLTLNWSLSCTTGSGGNGGVTVSPSGGAATVTYSSGSGSTAYVYTLSRTILQGETVTTSYTQPGDGVESTTGGYDVVSYSGSAVTNSSTQTGGGTTGGSSRAGAQVLTGATFTR